MVPATAAAEKLTNALDHSPFPGGGVIALHVVACIDYKSNLDTTHHQTRRAVMVVRPDGYAIFAPGVTYRDISFLPIERGDTAD